MRLPPFLRRRGIRTVVGIDWETYYDKDYSLRKQHISTTEYVRSPLFKAHGGGFRCHNRSKTTWVSHDDIEAHLATYDWDETAILCHHTAFDGLILSHHYGVTPKYYLDTLSMARALLSNHIGAGLDEVAQFLGLGHKVAGTLEKVKGIRDLPPALEKELAAYCRQDVDLMWEIFEEWQDFPEDEFDLIDLTIAAYADPVIECDKPRVEKELSRVIRVEQAFLRKVAKHFPEVTDPKILKKWDKEKLNKLQRIKAQLVSNNLFAETLEHNDIPVPAKISPTTGKQTFAFAKNDLDFQALLQSPNKDTRDLFEARLIAKSSQAETRARRLLSHADPKVPIMLNYCRAHTMRWSGGDKMNPQNFPAGRKKGENKELRHSLIAPKGHRLVVVDSSQIEARMVAWAAGQADVLDVFANGGDIYCHAASGIYGYETNKKDHPQERFVGKTATLGLGYGMGAPKFQHTLAVGQFGPPVDMPIGECQRVVYAWREANSKIVEFWDYMNGMLNVMSGGGVETWRDIVEFSEYGVEMPNGLMLMYPGLMPNLNSYGERASMSDFSYLNGKKRSKIYGGLFTENFIQCLARIAVADQILRLADRYRVVLAVHDEAVLCVPYRQASRALDDALEAFSTAPDWCSDLPVAGEGSIGKNYGDAK